MVEKVKEELFRLISIPSHRDFIPILKYIEDRLSYIPFEKQDVPGKGYNLIYKSSDIMINTHVDTVPPITMKNPFKPTENNGKIYGRGASDTKGLIASLIVALDMFKQKNPDKKIPVSISFTVDEEQNSALGSQLLLEKLDGISSVLVLEPTYGKICDRQMGTLEFSINVETESFHASEFEKSENPAKIGFRVIEGIEKLLNRPVNLLYFHSGWKFYATPGKADILAEVKVFEGENYSFLSEKIEDFVKGFGRKVSYTLEDGEDFISFKKGVLFEKIYESFESALLEKPEIGIMPSWTDAANFHKHGKECVVFGFGKLSEAHTEREHITLKELENNVNVLYKLLSILSH